MEVIQSELERFTRNPRTLRLTTVQNRGLSLKTSAWPVA